MKCSPSIRPAFSRSCSSCASPNFPRVCELDSAPAIFVVSSRSDLFVTAICVKSLRMSCSAAIRLRSASRACEASVSTDFFIASSSAVTRVVSLWALCIVAICFSSVVIEPFAAISCACAPALRTRATRKPISAPTMRQITPIDMVIGLSWQEPLTKRRRLYSL